jgi:hypothetical protein
MGMNPAMITIPRSITLVAMDVFNVLLVKYPLADSHAQNAQWDSS